MNKRITPAQKKIADAHIAAKIANKYDDPKIDGSTTQLKEILLAGKTVRYLMETIETRYCSVGSLLLANPELFGHQSKAYKANVYKGFKTALSNININ